MKTISRVDMNREELFELAELRMRAARSVLDESRFVEIWSEAGCRVNVVGSLRMGLMASHRDIDLHVYSSDITVESSFAVAARMAADARVTEVKCINGLDTDEHCIAWHVQFRADDGDVWQFDLIHIEEGTRYDGYFERVADRVAEIMTDEQRETILRLKFETPVGRDWHGVEYYEAVIDAGVRTLDQFERWVTSQRQGPQHYWAPQF